MKKIIFILITFILGFFVFSNNALALNSDATATCIYVFPDNDYYSGVTITYKNGDASGKCNISLKTNATFDYSCKVSVLRDFLINSSTEKMECPRLYYYYKFSTSFDILEDGNFNDFLSSDLGNHVFKVLDQSYYDDLSKSERKNATIKELYPSPSSSVDQGVKPLTDSEKVAYLQCKCGDILIKNGQVLFSDSVQKWYTQTYIPGFNPANLESCPENIYYRVYSVKRTIEISNGNFDKAQTLACASTSDIKKYSETTKNPTDYVEQEDVIKPFCEETAKIWKIVGYLVMALKIMVPAIIIVMGSIDLGKAVVAQSEDDIKKGTQLLIKRVIAGIIIFFIPTIVTIVLKMASKYSTAVSSNSTCIECVSKPGSC